MTPKRAKEIREAFGPCTVVYEAMTVEEIVKDAADMTDHEWVEIMLQVEEHDTETLSDGGTQHMKKLRERVTKWTS